MDLIQMRYAVEIAQCGSISKAAKKLYMGQPNLSKALRELEEELGRPLFRRTAQGIEPTRAGEEFLVYARKILSQVESLKALYQPQGQTEVQLSLCVPRASYVASAFCQWAQGHANGHFRLQYREANASDTIQNVFTGDAQLGIVRYHTAVSYTHLDVYKRQVVPPVERCSSRYAVHKKFLPKRRSLRRLLTRHTLLF